VIHIIQINSYSQFERQKKLTYTVHAKQSCIKNSAYTAMLLQ